MQAGKYDQALQLMNRAVEIFSSMPDPSFSAVGNEQLAQLYQLSGDTASEKESRARVLQDMGSESFPDSSSAAFDSSSVAIARANCNFALCCLRMGDAQEAIQRSSDVVDKFSNRSIGTEEDAVIVAHVHMVALTCRALANSEIDKFEESAADMEQAIALCGEIKQRIPTADSPEVSSAATTILHARLCCVLAHILRQQHLYNYGQDGEDSVTAEMYVLFVA
jgi:tetratricopeptide (TPR) repeat protein